MKHFNSNFICLLAVSAVLFGCSTSILGPQIAKTTPPSSTSSSTNQGQGQTPISAITCERTIGQDVFLSLNSAKLAFTCTSAVTSFETTDAPSFLTGAISDTIINFTGSATGVGTTTWSFTINDQPFTTGVTALTTSVIEPSSLTATVEGAFDVSGNNNSEISFTLDSSVDSFWSDSVADISLTALSLATDIPGLSLFENCTSPTVPYVCHNLMSSTNLDISRAMKIKWPFSAFDQGSYYFSINPRFSVDGNNLDTAVTNEKSFTLPIQSSGNIELSHAEANLKNGFTYEESRFPYGIDISPLSTSKKPILGLTFPFLQTTRRTNGKRILIDRNNDPTSGATGVTETDEISFSTENSQYMTIKSLASGNWVVVGAKLNTRLDLFFNKFSDSTTSNLGTDPTGVDLTAVPIGDKVGAVAISDPYTDLDSKERVAVAYIVYTGTAPALHIAKINPAGSNQTTILDDTNFGTESGNSTNQFVKTSGLTANHVDLVSIETTNESGIPQFYTAYRNNTDILLTKLAGSYSSGYSEDTGTLSSGVLAAQGTDELQSLDLSIGKSSGASIIGVVYQMADASCYFRRFDQTLTTVSQELKITETKCRLPKIHFNPDSGRFIVTMAQRNDSLGKYEIVSTEISLNSTNSGLDTKSANLVIRDIIGSDSNEPPSQLATAFYNEGNWIGVFYRNYNTSDIFIHGYHVSSK